MDVDSACLQETMNAMDGLNEIVELKTDADKDRFVSNAAESCNPLPAITGLAERYLILPSEKSMIACSRSSRS
jgi:hypothetical protein